MRVRSFRAPSAAEALLRAKAELGENAYILATKPTPQGVELVVVDGLATQGRSEIDTLRTELRELRHRIGGRIEETPDGLDDLAARLRGAGLETGLTNAILRSVLPHRGLAALEAAESEIASRVPILAPRTAHPGGPRVVAVVGPTGVGKTTTIAKLAGRLVQQGRRKTALLSLDTYRVGAVEQLRAYADLLGSPFEVAFTPADLVRAVQKYQDRDAILIDTTGRSPLDAEHLARLSTTLKLVDRLEILLALPATASAKALQLAAERFAVMSPTGLIATKLDETPHCGPLFSLAIERRLPLAFLTNGQNVPDDLERASAQRVAQLLLSAGAKNAGAAA